MINLTFPSREFDEAAAAACHGLLSDEQARALNELLRRDAAAQDEYILRLELHSRLASEPDLFLAVNERSPSAGDRVKSAARDGQINTLSLPALPRETSGAAPSLSSFGKSSPRSARRWAIALAACVALFAAGWWALRLSPPRDPKGATSKAVAMLNRTVAAQWSSREATPRPGAPLEPGWLRLDSGLAQIVFYSGARVVIEGPAALQIISSGEALCPGGRLTAEVPPEARGFRISTPQMSVTDLGTSFGLDVKEGRTEVHVFKGSVEFQPVTGTSKRTLKESGGAIAQGSNPPKLMAANPAAFASLFDLQFKSSAAEVLRHEQWRSASARLDEDPSLLAHFDFEQANTSEWRLHNSSARKTAVPDAAIVGCQWTEGRWPDKQALEFRGVSDRVRLNVPGEFESLTLATWVRVQGLDRQINSLFMSDGFEAGTIHWSIREDGVLPLTVIGAGVGNFQIVTSPPVLTLDRFGMWLHLAVVIDGSAKQVAQYVNGRRVTTKRLRQNPPFRIGTAELGNWNPRGFSGQDPFHIRNFSGAMDEFCLFGRALSADEIRALYSTGKPQPDAVATRQ